MSPILGTIINHTVFGFFLPLTITILGKLVDHIINVQADFLWPINVFFAIPICILGIYFRGSSEYYLQHGGQGYSFSTPNHEMVPAPSKLAKNGLYRYCRNPMIFGGFLITISLSVYFRSVIGSFIFFPLYVGSWTLFIIYREEPYLENKFGKAYAKYKQNTPRFLPGISKIAKG